MVSAGIETIQQNSDTSFQQSSITAGGITIFGTEGDDFVRGPSTDDYYDLRGGNDRVIENGGNDTYIGGKGNDNFIDYFGNDTYEFNLDDGQDSIYDYGGNDNIQFGTGITQDTVQFARIGDNVEISLLDTSDKITINSWYISDNRKIDNIKFNDGTSITKGEVDQIISGVIITGTDHDDSLIGSSIGNIIKAKSGNDFIDGGGGIDTMIGDIGDDTYIVDGYDDLITENAGEGTDTIQTNISYALGINLENLDLSGTSDISGTGNELDNYIQGNSGNNIIDGNSGTDILSGGLGDDTYIINDQDTIIEKINEGNDTVISTISNALGSNLENLALLGSDNLTGTGNELDNIITGNTGNNILDGGAGVDYLAGGLGNDTYIINDNDVISELTDQGIDTVQSSISYSLGLNIENLVLTGSDNINATGNELDNYIQANSGNNIIDGESGSDILAGGLGDDTYIINDQDTIIEQFNQGIDTVQSSISYSLGLNLENLTLLGSDNLDGIGNDLDNIINGDNGNNILDGGSGIDFLSGGLGNDTYIINDADIINENASEGIDTVVSSISYSLGSNLENLNLTGPDDLSGYGNKLINTIIGNNGNNILDGNAGTDYLAGGLGNDTYIINDNDVISELMDQGIDTVQSSISYSLGLNIENITLTGSDNIDATGNELDNYIQGNSGNNIIDGRAGSDILAGGLGDDTYIINDTDIVAENENEGTDTVKSSISYILGANLENLTLLGSDNLTGTGNELDNVIVGNAGDNILDGRSGKDILSGEMGNDTYIINDQDIIIELADRGHDLVRSCISYSLVDNIEDLQIAGSDNINGTGNELDNYIQGNSGNNIIDGESGSDILAGGLGDDTYIINDTDIVAENENEGIDTVVSSISYTLGNNLENLNLAGSDDLSGYGNELINTIIGNNGNNVLDGGIGIDYLAGDLGNDTYIINDQDTIIEKINEGNDTVKARFSYTLGSNLENIILTGQENINGIGNELNNTIIGNDGNNILDGDAGVNYLAGGLGNDTYIINDNDAISELMNQGIDTVQSSISYSLGLNIENLVLTGSVDINGTGNDLNNIINGNTENNVLDGRSGIDLLSGGLGNDTYIINDTDIIVENENEGIDTVKSSISYTLGNNIENLLLTGTNNNIATGNDLNNYIEGNTGNNTINGGSGVDRLVGRSGNDIYIIDDYDQIIELENEGIDTVRASISYTLGANLESLILTGSDNINGNGNDLNNVIKGNINDNILNGGTGVDYLAGGLGNDTYIINDNDAISELTDQGIDTVQSSISYSLGLNIENLTLLGSDNLDGLGNDLDNIINGNTGNNVLDGKSGFDLLSGGLGNDTYIINDNDAISELTDQGIDNVQSSISYSLGLNIENLTLTESDNIEATGNELDNYIQGNSGNNIIDGGSGSDILAGELGDDTYIINDLDTIIEQYNEGIDTVVSSISYTLENNLENITLKGAENLAAVGNELDNIITGNSGNNILTGASGNDRYHAGTGDDNITDTEGNDIYYFNINDGHDVISDSTGSDTIKFGNGISKDDLEFNRDSNNLVITLKNSSDTISITNWAVDSTYRIERLEFANGTYLTGDEINSQLKSIITGTNYEDILIGTLEDDTIYGLGGEDLITDLLGNDNIYGGAGNDTIMDLLGNDSIYGEDGNDLITDLTGNDVIYAGAGNDELHDFLGNDTIIGGTGNDALHDYSGSDTYMFNKGDGEDTIFDMDMDSPAQETDRIIFGSSIKKENIAVYMKGNDLIIGYGSGDEITIKNQDHDKKGIEVFKLDNGKYLTDNEISRMVQDMSAYAKSHHIAFKSVDDVYGNQNLMNIIINSWHS